LRRAGSSLDLRREIQLICRQVYLGFSAPDAIPSCHQQSGSQQSPAKRKQRVPEPWRSGYPFRQSELFQVSPSLNSRWNLKGDGNLAARATSKRSNCKGPLGLPCAVTPQRDMTVRVPSNHKNILRNGRPNVCPVVDNPGKIYGHLL
jgi:hypothetical protein